MNQDEAGVDKVTEDVAFEIADALIAYETEEEQS